MKKQALIKKNELLEAKKERKDLWNIIKAKPQDPVVVMKAIDILEECEALDDCVKQAEKGKEKVRVRASPARTNYLWPRSLGRVWTLPSGRQWLGGVGRAVSRPLEQRLREGW